MPLFNKQELEQAAQLVYQSMPPTPQYRWPKLCERFAAGVWVKHENHTPTGAFKARGAITFMHWLKREHPNCKGIITATRGNHGQSQAKAASQNGLVAKILVPLGNSPEKNNAMRAFGAELVEFGEDFDAARMEAIRLADEEGLFLVPPFHKELVRGVASYALELFSEAPDLDTVYVPIGCGSGICSVITVRDALELKTKIVGVVSNNANAAKRSFETGRIESTDSALTFADGVAVRIPVEEAFDIYSKGADRIVAVSDDEITEAMRIYFEDIHSVAEGAGAVSLAALNKERELLKGKEVAVILTGANIDSDVFSRVLAGKKP